MAAGAAAAASGSLDTAIHIHFEVFHFASDPARCWDIFARVLRPLGAPRFEHLEHPRRRADQGASPAFLHKGRALGNYFLCAQGPHDKSDQEIRWTCRRPFQKTTTRMSHQVSRTCCALSWSSLTHEFWPQAVADLGVSGSCTLREW